MGAWGPALFSDDLACDVRDAYRELIEDGVEDDDAVARVVAQYGETLEDPDEGPVFWMALAYTMSTVGRLTEAVGARALMAIERDLGLDRWRDDPRLLRRRQAALAKVRTQLTGPQPPRRKLRPPVRHVTDLEPGDVLGYRARAAVALYRVARISESRVSVSPILVRMDFSGHALPEPDRLDRIPDVDLRRRRALHEPGYRTSCLAMTIRKVTWADAGFLKLGRIAKSRRGDAEVTPASYADWAALARSLEHDLGR